MKQGVARASLVEAGLSVMTREGYNGTSVRDVVAAAGMPLGSFSNHFRSKEAFALDVLNRYFDDIRALLRETFEDGSLSPKQKLRRYFDVVTDKLADENWTKGCLVGLLSLEASGQNEALRNRLAALFGDWLEPFALEIAAAQDAGDIAPDFEPLDVAKFLLSSWQGAVLWMKVERGPAALELFKTIMFQTVLAGERLTAARAAAGQPESADGTVRCAGGDRAPDQPSGIR